MSDTWAAFIQGFIWGAIVLWFFGVSREVKCEIKGFRRGWTAGVDYEKQRRQG